MNQIPSLGFQAAGELGGCAANDPLPTLGPGPQLMLGSLLLDAGELSAGPPV